jgi:GNAT superfamily N-acetyltransferase
MIDTAQDLTLRPLELKDQAAWEMLWAGYLKYYESTVTPEVTQATFKRLCAQANPERAAIVAIKDDELIGFTHYIYHAHNWKLEDVCYLQDLFVAPSARGRGVAKALINAVYSAADAHGTPSVYWMTQDFNAPARRVYDDIGALTPFIKYQRP